MVTASYIASRFVGTKTELYLLYENKNLGGFARSCCPGDRARCGFGPRRRRWRRLARGVAGGGFHDGSGFHGRGDFHGGFTHHGSVPDRGRFRHDHDHFFGHSLAFGVPWPGYYDPYYAYDYRYHNYTAADSSDVILAVQRALAQLGYYHGPVDGVVGPQTERAIRWFQSADSLPVTGEIDSATLRSLRIG